MAACLYLVETQTRVPWPLARFFMAELDSLGHSMNSGSQVSRENTCVIFKGAKFNMATGGHIGSLTFELSKLEIRMILSGWIDHEEFDYGGIFIIWPHLTPKVKMAVHRQLQNSAFQLGMVHLWVKYFFFGIFRQQKYRLWGYNVHMTSFLTHRSCMSDFRHLEY